MSGPNLKGKSANWLEAELFVPERIEEEALEATDSVRFGNSILKYSGCVNISTFDEGKITGEYHNTNHMCC